MLKSQSSELRWPAVVAPRAAPLHGMLAQLLQTQWLPAPRLRALQARQLAARLNHACQHSALFRELLGASVVRPVQAFETLARLPLLTRQQMQGRGSDLFCSVPPGHEPLGENVTSGSTGEPVTVKCTRPAYTLRAALNLRGHLWHRLDFRHSFGAIRAGIRHGDGPHTDSLPDWGGSTGLLYQTGPSMAADITLPLDEQLRWIEQHRPNIFLTYPSNLRALMSLRDGPWPELKVLLTSSESLSPDLRAEVAQRWQVPLHDKYSSEELGLIAIECEHGSYHCSEHLVVEVLDDQGRPCAAGQPGRLVITDCYNFATAMIRYEIRDYAEPGEACPCGRGLPVLRRVLGRVRNIMTLPDGRQFWPLFGLRVYGELAPIRQAQYVQTAPDHLLMRVVMDRELTASEQEAIRQRVCGIIGHAMRIDFEQVQGRLNDAASGKFEEFKSLVTPTRLGGSGG